jgi:hypothetical protein
MGFYRQGDVLLVPRDVLPSGVKPVSAQNGRIVLAYGEATGHSHSIAAREGVTLFRSDGLVRGPGDWLLVTGGPVVLEHEEHDPITLPPGVYQQAIQVEETPEPARRQDRFNDPVVADWVRRGLATLPTQPPGVRWRRHRLVPHDQLMADLARDREDRF